MISVDTAKTVLVPASIYEEGMGERYLRFGGMAPGADEVVVVSGPHYGIVAVMSVSNSIVGDVSTSVVTQFSERKNNKGGVGVISPLFAVVDGFTTESSGDFRRSHRAKREVNILLTDDNVYIAVWEKGLRMAEVLPDNSPDSLLYYMQVLGRNFQLKRFDINIIGKMAEVVSDVLKPWFGSRVRVLG